MAKGHYFINESTQLTSYCLENYEEIKDIKDCYKIYKKYIDKYKKRNDRFMKAFQSFKMLSATGDKLFTPMGLTDEVLNTQFHDKVDDDKTLHYNETSCRLEGYVEQYQTQYNIFLDFETITSEYKHMPYLCWIYNDDIQQEFIGIDTCAADMLNALPHDKGEKSLIAHNLNYGCRFILQYLQNVKPIVESNRFSQISATYYNPESKKKIDITFKGSYKLIPMQFRDFGKCFKLDVSKEVMPYNVYTC